jgi:hypothetical protein
VLANAVGTTGRAEGKSDANHCVFRCGLCVETSFADPALLEKHVKEVHEGQKGQRGEQRSKRLGGTGGQTTGAQDPVKVDNNIKLKLTDSTERNWAAEFGYGRTSSDAAKKPGDLFLKMRSMFQVGEEEELEEEAREEKKKAKDDEDDDFAPFRTRGFRGKVKASLLKTPRTLSEASLVTRKRLETLIRKAREHQEKMKKSKKKKRKRERRSARKTTVASTTATNASTTVPTSSSSSTAATNQVSSSSEEDEEDESSNFDGFLDEDESLLFPLANGWVMERTPSSKDRRKFFTSFWSPYGVQCDDIEGVKTYCKKERISLDMTVFERALRRLQEQAKAS